MAPSFRSPLKSPDRLAEHREKPNADPNRIRAAALQGVTSVIAQHGGDAEQIFAHFGLDPGQAHRSDLTICYSSFILLLEYCAERLRRPHFALEVAELQTPAIFGPIAVLLEAASTVREALAYLMKYFFLQAPLTWFALAEMGASTVEIQFLSTVPKLTHKRQVNEQGLALIFKTISLLIGRRLSLDYVRIAAARPINGLDQVERHFGCAVVYEQGCNALAIPTEILREPLPKHNDWLARVVVEQLESLRSETGSAIEERVDKLAVNLLPLGHCRLEECARQLGVSPRTLQLRLKARGTDFASIVNRRQRDLAEAYLTDSHLAISEISTLVGYADQASFTRAFAGWTGTSPARFRKAKSPY